MKISRHFTEALNLNCHPLKDAKYRKRSEYIHTLLYIINACSIGKDVKKYTDMHIKNYCELLLPEMHTELYEQHDTDDGQMYLKKCISWPWKKKNRYALVCDIHLILLDEELIEKAMNIICGSLSPGAQNDLNRLAEVLSGRAGEDKRYNTVQSMIEQYQANKEFLAEKERRIIVTANMSAGKSTLINALAGKFITRTSQEVCTGNVCYISDKAFEDNRVHLYTDTLTMNAGYDDLRSYRWSEPVYIASYFSSCIPQKKRLRIIDTPGADAALHEGHTEATHNALLNEDYDLVLYIISPTNLGTDAEAKHLKWIAEHVPGYKVIFVLNKLDNYRDKGDSIRDSINDLREDLKKAGFENPVICPISAYFSYLLKLKTTGQSLSEDESDEFEYLSKKFMRPAYDLSVFHSKADVDEDESDELELSRRAGIYGLEKIIYGG